MTRIVFLLTVLFSPSIVFATPPAGSTEALLENCKIHLNERLLKDALKINDNTEVALYLIASAKCNSTIVGVVDTLNFYEFLLAGLSSSNLVCTPTNATSKQFAEIFVRYAGAHPEKFHEPATELVLESLSDAFPCKK